MIEPSAVEWLYAKMFEKNGRITREEFDQAIEMFEKQIKKSFLDGSQWELYGSDLTYEERAQEYYNETFKSE